MKTDIITGVIPTEEENIIFSSIEESFEFCFMTDSICFFPKKDKTVTINAKDDFIFGKTHDNYDIAIYSGNQDFKVMGATSLHTNAYIKSIRHVESTNLTEYDGIKFIGGTLNNVFVADALDIKYEDKKRVIKAKDDSIKYKFHTEEFNMDINICSSVFEQSGIKGKTISNTNVVLTIKFDKPQKLATLFKHYNKIKDIMSFMTFRENVGFDKVYLMKSYGNPTCLLNCAEAFILEEKNLTSKKIFNNISFADLGKSFTNLLQIIYRDRDNSKTVSLGFIPLNDKDARIMTNEKIKAVCTALECEFSFIPDVVGENRNETFNSLIKKVKATVKKFKKNNTLLSDGVYSLIFSNIKNWSFPMKEKNCALWHKYEQEMLILNKSTTTITNEMIKEAVQFRNDITHGRHRILNTKIAITAHYLSGLVYCCILERIGLDRGKIKELCKNKILS